MSVAQVSPGSLLPVDLPRSQPGPRPDLRDLAAAPPPRPRPPSPPDPSPQPADPACQTAHVSPLVRDPSPRGRLRYPDRPGPAGSPRRRHDHDLHPRPQSWARGGPQPSGPDAGDVGGGMGLRSSVVAGLSGVPMLGNAARMGKATDPHGLVRIGETGDGHRRAWAALACTARSMQGATQVRRIGSSANTKA